MDSADYRQNKSLKAAVQDGVAWAFMAGVGEAYLTAFAILLQASALAIGFLASLPSSIGALAQLLGVWLLTLIPSRRKLLVFCANLQALLWVPIAFVGLVAELAGLRWVGAFVVLAALYHVLAGVINPAWSSLIGDILPAEGRGAFFGLRNRRMGYATGAAIFTAAPVLYFFELWNYPLLGFALLFLLAAIARAYSARRLNEYEDPPHVSTAADRFTFVDFIRRLPQSNFAKFVLFVGLINFTMSFSGPYFSVYMLRELQFSLLMFTGLSFATVVSQILTLQHWGRLANQFGNKRILNVCGFGVGLAPLLWLFSTNYWYLIPVHMLAGFMWAGFNLSVSNFLFDAVSPPKRARCAAYQALVNGIFTFSGAMLGGWLVTNQDLHAWSPHAPYLTSFALSGLGRLAVALVFLRLFKEVREVEDIRHRDLVFKMVNVRPFSGLSFGFDSRKEPPP